MFYFALRINIMAQLAKYDVHTTRKIKFIHAIIYHILLFSLISDTLLPYTLEQSTTTTTTTTAMRLFL